MCGYDGTMWQGWANLEMSMPTFSLWFGGYLPFIHQILCLLGLQSSTCLSLRVFSQQQYLVQMPRTQLTNHGDHHSGQNQTKFIWWARSPNVISCYFQLSSLWPASMCRTGFTSAYIEELSVWMIPADWS